MSRIVYVNGAYLSEEDAQISVFDRGFLFADAVYEVTSVLEGKLVDFPAHMARLERSLSELNIPAPMDAAALREVHQQLLARNELSEGLIYLQVTRGAEDRDFAFREDLTPGIVLFTQVKNIRDAALAARGAKIISLPDNRWARRDIKTVQLLAPSLAKMEAKARGADDAWMVEDGFVTEGTSNNAYIVTQEGTIVTRNLGPEILHGITRAAVLTYARQAQIKVEERPFTLAEAQSAQEAFITSATSFVTAVVEIDGNPIATGSPGPIAKRLRELYIEESLKRAE